MRLFYIEYSIKGKETIGEMISEVTATKAIKKLFGKLGKNAFFTKIIKIAQVKLS